jgi:hypothetical protein
MAGDAATLGKDSVYNALQQKVTEGQANITTTANEAKKATAALQ